jgi:hypothetical protein
LTTGVLALWFFVNRLVRSPAWLKKQARDHRELDPVVFGLINRMEIENPMSGFDFEHELTIYKDAYKIDCKEAIRDER